MFLLFVYISYFKCLWVRVSRKAKVCFERVWRASVSDASFQIDMKSESGRKQGFLCNSQYLGLRLGPTVRFIGVCA